MKIEHKNSNNERRILIALIVDKKVLGRISAKWTTRLFKNRWSNLIASWCVTYYKKYQKAPMKEIESLFASWSVKSHDKETAGLIEKFLQTLSEEYDSYQEEINSDYVIDLAAKYFNLVKMEQTIEAIQEDLGQEDVEKATARFTAFSKIDMGLGAGINALHDQEAIMSAFDEGEEALVTYPGALGKFFGNQLSRDKFIAFLSPDKRGKSFWLLDIAYRAMLQRKKVAYFDAGDMGQRDTMRRLMSRISRHPIRAKTIQYPMLIEHEEGTEFAHVEHDEKVFTDDLDWRVALRACRDVMRKKVKSKASLFKLSCHVTKTLSVSGIRNILTEWERNEEWTPDLIVVDYADILNMACYGSDGRDRYDETWADLRALSLKQHCLVVTATQANAKAYDAKSINMGNFSEDKRKNAHVTGLVALNMTKEEKAKGIYRLNWVLLREDEFNSEKFVHVASCLGLSNPSVKSTF